MKVDHSPLINDFLCFYIESRIDGELRYETAIHYYPTSFYVIKDLVTGQEHEFPFADESTVEHEIRWRVESMADAA